MNSDGAGNSGGYAASFGNLLTHAAATSTHAEIVFPGDRRSLSDLAARANDYAAVLVDAGVPPGGKVGLWLPPSADLIAAIFGCARAGCVAVPISDRFRAAELAHVVPHAEMALLFTVAGDDHLDRLATLRQALPGLPESDLARLNLAEAPALRSIVTNEAVKQAKSAVADRPPVDDLALLMFTSGTSAKAKACMIKHSSLLAQAASLANDRYLLTSESVVWSPLPLFHIAGLVGMLAAVSAAATFLHSGVFQVMTSLQLLEAEKATHALAAFETIWMQLLDHQRDRGTDLSSLTTGLSANGEQQLRTLQARLPGVAFIANYGSTEGTGHVSMARPDEPEQVRVLGGGLPLPGTQVRIVDLETGQVAATGEPGEIQFRGVSLFAGYYKDEPATRAATADGGWFKSGDLGNLDSTGRLYFRGRLKDMLKVGGENVAALEVESYLLTHPAVNIATVVGVPDDYYGEVPAAFVELAPGAELRESELIDYCLGNIATYKVPRYVRIVDTWPMSGTKIHKIELRESLIAELRLTGVTAAPRLSSRPRTAS